MTELNLVVIADDDEIRHVENDVGYSVLQVAPPVLGVGWFWPVLAWEGSGIRFQNVTILKNLEITSAILTFTASTSYSMANCNCEISAQDADNPDGFTGETSASLEARWASRTSAQVNWDNIAAWTKDSTYESPDIKAVIQEIVNRPGWASGNAIVIFWDDWSHESSGAQKTRRAYAYNVSNAKAVTLKIVYIPAVVPSVTTNPATAIR